MTPFLLVALMLAGQRAPQQQRAEEPLPLARPVPRFQVLPQPYDQISFQRDGGELTRLHFGRDLQRPFLFPLRGPRGALLTRMGHPHDVVGHNHHTSLWIAHANVGGVDFWNDRAGGKISYRPVVREIFAERDTSAATRMIFAWVDELEDRVLMYERRQIGVVDLPAGDWMLVLDLEFTPADDSVMLGKTPFGFVGIRMAKTVGVTDGGGLVRNSEGGRGEENVIGKKARWVDYSGPLGGNNRGGITLMDHPSNPRYPTVFHVRDDGWMGTSLTYEAEMVVEKSNPLRLRYGFWIHGGVPVKEAIDLVFAEFSKREPPDWSQAWK